MRNGYAFIGYIAAMLTTFSGVPQMLRILRLRESRDVSLWTSTMLATGTLFWLIHGLIIDDLPVILANAVALVLTVTLVCLILRYR